MQHRPKSAARAKRRPDGERGSDLSDSAPGDEVQSPKRGKIRPRSAPIGTQRKVRAGQGTPRAASRSSVLVLLQDQAPVRQQHTVANAGEKLSHGMAIETMGRQHQNDAVDVGKYLDLDAWWGEFDEDRSVSHSPDIENARNVELSGQRSNSHVKRVTSLVKNKAVRESSSEVTFS